MNKGGDGSDTESHVDRTATLDNNKYRTNGTQANAATRLDTVAEDSVDQLGQGQDNHFRGDYTSDVTYNEQKTLTSDFALVYL